MEINKNASKYILYARKSTESEDRQQTSVEDQIREMKKIAERNNLNIIEIISENGSGFKMGRPGFFQLLETIKSKKADGILCWKLSRLARNFDDAGPIMGMLQRSEIKHIKTYDKDWYPDYNTLYLSLEFGVTNQFSRDLGVDTMRGLRSKAERGWYPCATLPLGYKHNPIEVERKHSDKEIVNDEPMYYIIKAALKELAEKKYSPKQVYDRAVNNGFRTRKGTIPSYSVFYRIVKHPFYYGEFEFTIDNEEKIFQGNHEAMITRQEHENIIQALRKGSRVRHQKHFHAFTGLMTCGECGCSYTSTPTKIKVNKKGEIHKFKYYNCTKKKGPCSQPHIREEVLIEKFGQVLNMIHIPEELVDYALEEIQNEHIGNSRVRQCVLKNNQKEYELLSKRLDTLTDKNLDGTIDDDEYKKKRDEIKAHMALIQSLINTNDSSRDEWLKRAKKRLSFAEMAVETFNEGSQEVKKDIMMELQSQIVIKNKNIQVDLDPLLSLFFNKPTQKDLAKVLVRTKTNEAGSSVFEIFFNENAKWGGRWDLNPQPSVPQTDALTD